MKNLYNSRVGKKYKQSYTSCHFPIPHLTVKRIVSHVTRLKILLSELVLVYLGYAVFSWWHLNHTTLAGRISAIIIVSLFAPPCNRFVSAWINDWFGTQESAYCCVENKKI